MIRANGVRRARPASRIGIAGLILCAVALQAATPPAANIEQVYAAFTVKLTRFVTWPESCFGAKDAPFVIGTFPGDPINAELDAAVRGLFVNSHPIRTLRFGTIDDVQRCQLVFVSRQTGRVRGIMSRLVRRPILTVSDADGFLDLGGHVQFAAREAQVKLYISADNLKKSGLEAQAQLLRLASPVAPTP